MPDLTIPAQTYRAYRGHAEIDGRAEMDGLLNDLRSGRGRVVRVTGGPGTGKTALLAEALSGAGGAGCALAFSSGRSGSRYPLGTAMECLGLDPASPTLRTVLERPGLDADRTASTRLLGMFRTLGRQAPLIVVIDDLDEADAESVELVARLAVEAPALPVLLLTSSSAPGPLRLNAA